MKKNKCEFSLIMATCGRINEPVKFIEKLLNSKFDLEKIQLIIIDQNDSDDLLNKIKIFIEDQSDSINYIYKKIEVKGLSVARNYGLKYANGKYIAFPDDDCHYFPETLNNVYEYFITNPSVYAIMGRVVDEDSKDIIRKWPSSVQKLTKWNFYTNFSSVGWFLRKENINEIIFCEQLGVGNYFGSAEDADLLYNYLKRDKNIYFVPTLKIYHPQNNNESLVRIINYGRGFGAFCRKNLDPTICILFCMVLIYHTFLLMKFIGAFKKENIKARWLFIFSRIQGFVHWKNKKIN